MAHPTDISMEAIDQLADESLAIWSRASDIWLTLVTALLAARGPGQVFAAQAAFLADSAGIFTSSAGLMLRRHGLQAPTLNEA